MVFKFLVAILLVSGIAMGWSQKHDVKNEVLDLRAQLQATQIELDKYRKQIEELELKVFLAQNRVPIAGDLARAILSCPPENRKLLAAIAVKESRGNTRAVGAAGERGIFQVQAKHWGKVPTTIEGQVRQANNILTYLKKWKGSEFRAVMAYNGSGYKARRYAESIFEMRSLIN